MFPRHCSSGVEATSLEVSSVAAASGIAELPVISNTSVPEALSRKFLREMSIACLHIGLSYQVSYSTKILLPVTC